jgi:hypothetical protein
MSKRNPRCQSFIGKDGKVTDCTCGWCGVAPELLNNTEQLVNPKPIDHVLTTSVNDILMTFGLNCISRGYVHRDDVNQAEEALIEELG